MRGEAMYTDSTTLRSSPSARNGANWMRGSGRCCAVEHTNPALLAGHDLRLRVVDLQQMGRAIAHIAAGQLWILRN